MKKLYYLSTIDVLIVIYVAVTGFLSMQYLSKSIVLSVFMLPMSIAITILAIVSCRMPPFLQPYSPLSIKGQLIAASIMPAVILMLAAYAAIQMDWTALCLHLMVFGLFTLIAIQQLAIIWKARRQD